MVDWFAVRQLMLTSSDMFPSPPWEKHVNKMDALIRCDQVQIVERCLKALHRGLQWAMEYDLRAGRLAQKKLGSYFLIEDEHMIGVFKDCSQVQCRKHYPTVYPKTLQEYIEHQASGDSFIVAEVVFEKDNLRLANRYEQRRQSQLLRDVIYPALVGLMIHYSDGYLKTDWNDQKSLSLLCVRARQAPGNLLNTSLLTDIFTDHQKSDAYLIEHSPLELFYETHSPFNINIKLPESEHLMEQGFQESRGDVQ